VGCCLVCLGIFVPSVLDLVLLGFCVGEVGSGSFRGAEVRRVFLYLGEFSVVGGWDCGYLLF
jgi:hypothetical protein